MRIPAFKEAIARQLILNGTTTRNVGRMAGIGRMSAWRLSKLVLQGRTLHCGCGRGSGHRGMCGYRLARCESYLARQPKHEAEIDLLTRRAEMMSLDSAGGHEFIASAQASPLELLMQREEGG